MRTFALSVLVVITGLLHAQVTIFQTGFDGAPQAFDLNTTDAGSQSSGANTWLINNVYAGGTGDVLCSGIPLNYTIPSVPAQPAGIANPNGGYLHIASSEAVADGILSCSFAAADGFCTLPDDHFARMNGDVSTVGMTGVTLSFWWLCNGGNQNYGEVYYSTDGGATWIQLTTPISQYRNQGSWTQQTIALAAFDGLATLRFGFRFHNGSSLLGGNDPGFGVDDITISGTMGGGNSIACQPNGSQVCAGSLLQVQYSIQGAFTAGNVFTLQLSDAFGSFAAPVDIGSVTSTTAGIIIGTIPPGTPSGAGYRVRVNGSAPTTAGSQSALPIVITIAPEAGLSSTDTICSNAPPFTLISLLGGSPDLFGSWTDPNGAPSNGVFIPGVSASGCYTYTVPGSGGCAPTSSTVCITVEQAPNAGASSFVTLCSNAPPLNLPTYLGGSPDPGGTWTDPQGNPFTGPFIPGTSLPGCYTYTVSGTAACNDASSTLCIAVNTAPDAGLSYTGPACSTGGPILMYDQLGGAPQPGGTWAMGGAPHGPFFVPGVDPLGCYTYTVQGNAPCANATSVLCITGVVAPSDAGSDSSIVICADGGPYDLFDGLGGSPATGGTWLTFGGAPFSGIFDPLVNGAGPYIYQVAGTVPCPDDEAVVTVTVDPCTGIADPFVDGALTILRNDGEGRYVIRTDHAAKGLFVFDMLGRRAGKLRATGTTIEVDLSAEPAGYYVLRVHDGEGALALRLMRP